MNPIHLSRIDLNLLVIFEAVARYRSVTLAAQQLALSQSTLSHALKRLRVILEDELVVRGRNGLVLTPKAEYLLPKVQLIIQYSADVFALSTFDPITTTHCFKLAASDYSIATIIPKLIKVLAHTAPNAQLTIENYSAETLQRLEQGELDVALIGNQPPSSPFEALELFDEHMVGLISANHPLAHKVLDQRMSLDEYLAYRHIVVSFKDPQPSLIDVQLQKLGRERNIAVRSPNMLANIAILSQSDLIMNVPSRLVSTLNNASLVAFKLPLPQSPQQYSLIWHKRLNQAVAFLWFKKLIESIAKP